MNPELEALVLALDAVLLARSGTEAEKMELIYQAKLDQFLAGRSGLSRERLARAVDYAYWKWRRAQDTKPTHLPPKA